MADFDVLIAGGGPAGCATAVSLADFAPDLRVGLIEPAETGVSRIGETVPPHIKPLLDHLGLWTRFAGGGHCPSYRTTAAWGDEQIGCNEFLLHANQTGWRLDRGAFDRMLLDAASVRIAARFTAKVLAAHRDDDAWRLALSDGTRKRARFVVDATGNAAIVARQCRLPKTQPDRLVACCLHTRSRSDGTEGLLIESFAEGWWYTAALPGGRRIVACMTDADRVRPLGLSRPDGFMALLAGTSHVRRVVDIGTPHVRPMIWPAGSRLFGIDPALKLLCVGDAGSRYDPVSGQGIVKALRGGIFASYAIADWLQRADERGLHRYHLMLQREFAVYRDTLKTYYAQEQRWVRNPFWRRRHDG